MSIETIAIVHHVHTDFGYTDHPARSAKEHIKYINQAVDYVLQSSDYPEGARFAWTQEQQYPLRQWWQTASELEKDRFFEAVKTGRLEITGSAFNVTAFLNREEWEHVMHWIPDMLWDRCQIRSVMQIDVNGMHTQGMVEAYDRGIRNLWVGPNSYYGVPPMPTPVLFHWKLDEKRTMLTWINSSYNNGTFLFNKNWRQGPVPNYSDLRYRPPENGDIWASDDASILAAHEMCLKNIAMIEGQSSSDQTAENDGFTKARVFGGYTLSTLPVSVTSQWRVDNDPPFFPIVEFVRRWNEMGLKPALKLCTLTQALEDVQTEMGDAIPTYSGQWIDWWANGNASSPVEMSVCRKAKRTLKAAKSPLFGELTQDHKEDSKQVLENICLYDEHCFGSWQSVSAPYSFASLSQAAEKNIYAYRALDGAECLLAERARAVCTDSRNEILVWNTEPFEKSVSIELPLGCMRGEYHSILRTDTGERYPIRYTSGAANFMRPQTEKEFGEENVSHTFSDSCERQAVAFGPVRLDPESCLHLLACKESCEDAPQDDSEEIAELVLSSSGWPQKLRFRGQNSSVINGSFGELVSVEADGFAPRWTLKDIFETDDENARAALRAQHLHEIRAAYGAAKLTRQGHLIRFEQPVLHKALNFGKRILLIDPENKQISYELRINRRSSFDPEVLFLEFEAPDAQELPYISNAGVPFRPMLDQLPGSCMDFYAIDGWIHYDTGWLLHCRDTALVSFGATSVVARKQSLMGPVNRIYARIFDNIWDTNFTANACGLMQFGFFCKTDTELSQAEELARCMETEPVVAVKMGYAKERKNDHT